MPEVLSLLAANPCGPQRGASGATKREFTGRIRVYVDPQLPLRSDFNAREEHLSFEQKTGKFGEHPHLSPASAIPALLHPEIVFFRHDSTQSHHWRMPLRHPWNPR